MKKNIFKQIFVAATLILGLTACDDRDLITVDNTTGPIVMDLSASKLVLDSNFPTNPALTVNWQGATTTVPVELNYKVEISSSAKFENPTTIATTAQSITNATFGTQQLNEAAKKIGLIPYEAQKMYFRVTSYLVNGGLSQQSKITSLTITPYLASPTYEYTDLFLIGSAAVGNWDNLATNNTLVPLLKTSTASKYTFTGLFKNGTDLGFKMIKVKGSWDAQFGFGSDGVLSTDGGSGNLTVPADGYYKLTVDTAALTYTLTPVTPPTATYSTISIIGTVNGNYNTDTDLTQSTFDPHLWYISNVSLTSGDFKFRANHSWDVNWGGSSQYFGTSSVNGPNIPLASEWTYNVYFNDASGDYTIIPVK